MKLTLYIFEKHERTSDKKTYAVILGDAWLTPYLTRSEVMKMYSFYREHIGTLLKSLGLDLSVELSESAEEFYSNRPYRETIENDSSCVCNPETKNCPTCVHSVIRDWRYKCNLKNEIQSSPYESCAEHESKNKKGLKCCD